MRLIDADAEIVRIEQEIQRIDEKIGRLKKLVAEEPSNTLRNFEKELEQCYKNKTDCKIEIATLKNYQTAYGVEKVIERLQAELTLADEEKKRCIKENSLQFDVAKGYAQGIAVAIEIVKSGINGI